MGSALWALHSSIALWHSKLALHLGTALWGCILTLHSGPTSLVMLLVQSECTALHNTCVQTMPQSHWPSSCHKVTGPYTWTYFAGVYKVTGPHSWTYSCWCIHRGSCAVMLQCTPHARRRAIAGTRLMTLIWCSAQCRPSAAWISCMQTCAFWGYGSCLIQQDVAFFCLAAANA